jgi:hypothetical protein
MGRKADVNGLVCGHKASWSRETAGHLRVAPEPSGLPKPHGSIQDGTDLGLERCKRVGEINRTRLRTHA